MTFKPNNLSRWLALLAALVLLVFAGVLPRVSHPQPLQVALGVWPGGETFIVAREIGMLPAERVKLIDVPWPSAAMRAFGNQVVDAAVLSLDEVLRLREPNREVIVVMVMDISQGADVVMGSQRAKSLAELRGKRAGVDIRSSGMMLLEFALQSAGLHSDALELVPLNPSEMEGALSEGKVDAVVLAEPWATRLKHAGSMVLFDSGQLKMPMYRMLVASAQAIREHPDELRLLIDAHFALSAEMSVKSDDSQWQVALRREGLSAAEFQQCLRRTKILDRETSARLMEPHAELESHAAELEDFMAASGLLEGHLQGFPKGKQWVDASLLKNAP